MRYMTKTMMATLAAGGLAAFSGTDASAQAPAGTYVLAEVQGQALPVLTEEENGCREEVLAATLTLEADGDWEMEYTERETCGAEVEEDEEDAEGDFTVDGTTVRFSDDDESRDPTDEIDLDELGVGTLSEAGLSVRLQDGRTVLVFRR